MSAPKRSMSGATGGLLGFVGMSALAGVLVTASVTPAIAVTGIAASSGIQMFENLPGYLKIDELAQKSDVIATGPDGSETVLASFFVENREEVGWDDISQFVKDAAIAGEDPRYYDHGGVDIQGTLRGAIKTFTGEDVQGGSSITQQYVKNVLINNGMSEAKTQEERDAAFLEATTADGSEGITRKIKEMRYAIALEKEYSKDKILQGYLNIAAFGGRVYGIESAANYYYGTTAKDLTLAQAASLIAIVNEPNSLRLDRPDSESNGANTVDDSGEVVPYAANKARRDYILGKMLEEKKITKEQYDEAVASPIEPNISEPSTGCQSAGGSAYFCDYVTWVIRNHYDDPETDDVDEGLKLLETGGLQIYTTLDLEMQIRSEQAMEQNVPFADERFDVGSVAVSVQPGTGKVLSMVQNKHYSNSEDTAEDPTYTAVNYATDYAYGGSRGFQPGSTFKTFTLAEWLNEGHSLTETFNGNRRAFTQFPDSCNGTWYGSFDPRNDDATNANNATDATKYSVNTAFMAMAQMTDLCKIKQTAEAFGIKRADGARLGEGKNSEGETITFGPSAVLGTEEVSPLSMAVAFAGIANNGVTCSPIAIERIVGPDGNEIEPPKSECTQSVTGEVASAMQYAMQQTFSGTAGESNTYSGVPHIGKTGTTDEAKDTWMVGASTAVSTAVWVGSVTGEMNLREVYFDSGYAATARHRMWRYIMELGDAKYGGNGFPEPGSWAFKQVLIPIPQVTGLSLEEAKKAIEDAGFVFEHAGDQDSPLPAGQVSGSDPVGEAGRGTNVRVFTSNGQGATVPNVVGMTLSEAKSAIEAAGLRFSGNGPNDSVVSSQNPAADSAVKRGSRVTVELERSRPTDPPGNGGGNDGGSPGDGGDAGTDGNDD